MATSELAAKLAAMRKRMEESSEVVDDSHTSRAETNSATAPNKADINNAVETRSSFQAAKTMFGEKSISGGGSSAGSNCNADIGKKSTSAQKIICSEDSLSTATATTSTSLSVEESLPPLLGRQVVDDSIKNNSVSKTVGEQKGMSPPQGSQGSGDAANTSSTNSKVLETHSQSYVSTGRTTQVQVTNKSPVSTLRYDPGSAMTPTCLDQSMESTITASTSFESENRPLLSLSKCTTSKSGSGKENNGEAETQHVTFESFKPVESWTEEGEGDPIIPNISPSNPVRDASPVAFHSGGAQSRHHQDSPQVADHEDWSVRVNGVPAHYPSHRLYDEQAFRDLQQKNMQLQKELDSANNLLLEKDQMIMYLTERLDVYETEQHNRYLASSNSNNSSPSRQSNNGNSPTHQGRRNDAHSSSLDSGKVVELKSALKSSKKNRRFLC